MYVCEGKATQGAGMTFHLLLVSPHTEIMGVTQHIFYRLHLGCMNNFFLVSHVPIIDFAVINETPILRCSSLRRFIDFLNLLRTDDRRIGVSN